MSKKIVILEPLAYSNESTQKDSLKISGVCQIETDQLDKLFKSYKIFNFKTLKEIKSGKVDNDDNDNE